MSALRHLSSKSDPPLFLIGCCETTTAAQDALAENDVTPSFLFQRHERGDWGQVSDWLCRANAQAVRQELSSHVIESRYRLDDSLEVWLMTAPDRSHTLLLLSSEFQDREVSSREGYAVWSAGYDSVPNPLIAVEQPVVDALLAGPASGGVAADVGAGTGRVALGLARQGWDVTGFDQSPEMLLVARQVAEAAGLSRIEFIEASLEEGLPADAGQFDLLTCALVLCHIPDIQAAVRECARLVRTGRHMLLTDFHPQAIAWGWRTAFMEPGMRYLLPNPGHIRDDYLQALSAADCTVLNAQDIALDGKPFGDLSTESVQRRGEPPLCLTLLARRNSSDSRAYAGAIVEKDAK